MCHLTTVFKCVTPSPYVRNRSKNMDVDWKRMTAANNLQHTGRHMGKARHFKNHVTPAVFPFVVTSTFV